MAWYSDEQYEMIKDSREKKSTAASAFKQRSHCGKGGRVRFPSDYMNKKELKAMNGECKSYRMGDPISWDVFKTWPEEHQKNYILHVREKYNVPNAVLAKAMGANEVTLNQYIKCLNIPQEKETRPNDISGFLAWWNGNNDTEPVEEPDLRNPMTWEQFKAMSAENKTAYIEWIRYYFGAPDKYIATMLFKVTQYTLGKYVMKLGLNKGKENSNSKRKWEKDSFQAWCDRMKKKTDICPTETVTETIAENTPVEPLEAVEEANADTTETVDVSETVETDICPETCEEVESVEKDNDSPVKEDAVPVMFEPSGCGFISEPYTHTAKRIQEPAPAPVIPNSGTMNFKNNSANDILATLKTLLGDAQVKLTVSWECI